MRVRIVELERFQTAKVTFMSMKVSTGAIEAAYDLLFVFHCNYVSILNRFRYIITYLLRFKKVT